MLPLTRQLLQTDLDGHPVDEVEDVITAALDDPRYLDRVPALERLLTDPTTPRDDRFLIVSALASWATRTGLETVERAARVPDESPFRGATADRRYSVDDSFAYLAESVAMSDEFTERFGTTELRVSASQALIRLGSSEFYDWQLSYLVSRVGATAVRAEIDAAIREGLVNLAAGNTPFPLGPQLADLATALTDGDEEAAVEYGLQIAGVDSSLDTLRHLVGIISQGKRNTSLELATYISLVGGDAISDGLSMALKNRPEASGTQ